MIFGNLKPLNTLLKNCELDSGLKSDVRNLKRNITSMRSHMFVGSIGAALTPACLSYPDWAGMLAGGMWAVTAAVSALSYSDDRKRAQIRSGDLFQALSQTNPDLATQYKNDPAAPVSPTPRKMGR